MYEEDELLMLSGIQHIAFCERQFALAYIEQQWAENVLTVQGHQLHERVDDPALTEFLQEKVVLRAMSLVSFKLGLYGRADVVELIPCISDDHTGVIVLKDRIGWWKIVPVEYKRGKPKRTDCDEVQLCAQAICLEEMYGISVESGWLYYGEIRRRTKVDFTHSLRLQVEKYSQRMHELFCKGLSPPATFLPHCNSCSLYNFCLPSVCVGDGIASNYLFSNLI
jgi:CRISPR-associated exonuclease Cas4